ncbi:hypothetical protein BLOT_014808 [Blomia tropicalis]|nr:hypothetical protein BLOT_014808 [Blomia tropicalis]
MIATYSAFVDIRAVIRHSFIHSILRIEQIEPSKNSVTAFAAIRSGLVPLTVGLIKLKFDII